MSPGGRPGGVASLSMATTSTPAAAAAAWSFGTTLAGSEKGNSSARLAQRGDPLAVAARFSPPDGCAMVHSWASTCVLLKPPGVAAREYQASPRSARPGSRGTSTCWPVDAKT